MPYYGHKIWIVRLRRKINYTRTVLVAGWPIKIEKENQIRETHISARSF